MTAKLQLDRLLGTIYEQSDLQSTYEHQNPIVCGCRQLSLTKYLKLLHYFSIGGF